jgi:hypothetical protein
MENSKNSISSGRDVVSKDVNLPRRYPAHWVRPNGDLDWDAVDIRWAIDHSDRQSRFSKLLESIRKRLNLLRGWFR